MRYSFDFDSTLDIDTVQAYAKELVDKGLDVWITTSRLSNSDAPSESWNKDLYDVVKLVGINKEHIKFCAYNDKYEYFKDSDFVWHLDDDWGEIKLINKNTDTVGISVFGKSDWRAECNKLIN